MIMRASKRLEYVKSQSITEDNASFLFEDIYEIMRECVHGLMAANGYKPYSHEATVAFLDENYKSYFGEKLVEAFNRYRIIRNNIMYRANFVSKEEAINALDVAENFVRKTTDLL
ncbi:Uncharacterised protein [uncultured archaeon]|nr:Uncharacterised protein [uncultured archaeon]